MTTKTYESRNLTPSQRADLAQHTLSAVRLALLQNGWAQVRPDRFERGPEGAETRYVYGQSRVAVWATRRSVSPVAEFSFVGQPRDSAEMDRFKTLIK
jgi:hypothetical protein